LEVEVKGGLLLLSITLLAAVVAALWQPQSSRFRAKPVAAQQQIRAFLQALTAYHEDTKTYPPSLQGLRVAPSGVSGWQGPYLPQEIPTDPWSRPYIYKYPGEHGDEPDILSLGADGQPGGTDIAEDIVSWTSK
jgi:general secretion pathway protein G